MNQKKYEQVPIEERVAPLLPSEPVEAPGYDDEVHQQFFTYERTGAVVTIKGKKERSIGSPAIIPKDTPTFKFGATFTNLPAGCFVLCWHVKLLEDFSIPNGLRFSVVVTYDAEPDTTGSLDVIMPAKELKALVKDRSYDLKLEELVVVQPYLPNHLGKKQWAKIEVAMSNCESINQKYSGLQVLSVTLRPFTGRNEIVTANPATDKTVIEHPVKRATNPNFTINAMDSPVFKYDPDLDKSPPDIPITRIAWSKDSTFLATLALRKNTAYITVWDMRHIEDPSIPPMDMSIFRHHCATAVVKHGTERDFASLAIGLAISPKGDQVAIYQEPKIGQWAYGSKLDQCAFEFTLLYQTINQSSGYVSVDMGGTASQLERQYHPPHRLLKNFIGYGAFLTERKNTTDWELNDFVTAPLAGVDAGGRVGDVDGKVGKGGKDPDDKTPNTLFVACNGIYIEIFKFRINLGIKPEHRKHNWESTHIIKLTDLTPTLSRRITCKMMMDVISSNTFMWIEDNGLCCTIWDLKKGSNLSHISSTGNARFRGQAFRGNSKMAISPDESIVALARDGTLTTYYTHTGITISERKLPSLKIEYVAFYGQNNQLFVIARHNTTLELVTGMLDPLQLIAGAFANLVPIPIIGKTILAFFRVQSFNNKGLICDADGSNIHCYVPFEPSINVVDNSEANLLDPTSNHVVQQGSAQYEVRTAIHKESFQDGDGLMYWVLRAEVSTGDKKVVFSFVPEPWMRVSTAVVREPGRLQSVYFLRCKKRFVVVGMQTLQIWSLPTSDNRDDFNLVFIWSRPRTEDDPQWSDGKPYKSEQVGTYYHCIRDAFIRQGPGAANAEAKTELMEAEAEIKLMEGSKMDVVSIPAAQNGDSRSTFLGCARSIHLLAATYAYSTQMSKDFPKNSRKSSLTYEEHANAITRFARNHINRLLPSEDFYPRPPTRDFNRDNYVQTPIQTTQAQELMQEQDGITPAPIAQPISIVTQEKLNDYNLTQSTSKNKPGADSKPADSKSTVLSIGINNTVRANRCRTNVVRKILPENFLDYVDDQKRKWRPGDEDVWSTEVATVLTLLLDQHDLKDANHRFVEGLLDTELGEWIPHANKALNPIKRAIKFRYEQVLETLIDYCVKNAKKYHPAYLTPAIQCLNELSKRYPDILGDLFRRASYVPAHDPEYVASHAIIANMRFSDWITFFAHYFTFSLYKGRLCETTKCPDINHYMKPVFCLRSQLPLQSTNWDFRNIESPMHWMREASFPREKERKKPGEVTEIFSHKIYVAPFPKMSSFGQYRSWAAKYRFNRVKSGFRKLSGRSFFDSPAMQATLEYKWHKYGLVHWVMPFIISLTFFVCMMIITAMQINSSSPLEEGDNRNVRPNDAQIAYRYLEDWRRFFIFTIVIGVILLVIDVRRVLISFKAIKSSYLLMRATAYILSVVGCFKFVSYKRGTINPGIEMDGGPSQIWYMSFGILALYLNMLFELRVFKSVGVPVYIIVKIMWRVRWFFMILALFVVSFTHALLHLMHTRSYDPCKNDACKDDYPDEYPKQFLQAMSVTTFFLAGRYDPVDKSLEKGPPSFHAMMTIFFMFTALLITNILIAWMGHAFTQCKQEGLDAWHRQWSEVIADVELSFMSNSSRYNRNMFPDYIYYGASEKVAAQYESTYSSIASRSNLSLENKYLLDNLSRKHMQTHSVQHTIIQTIKGSSNQQIQEMQADFNKKLEDIMKHLGVPQGVSSASSSTSQTTEIDPPQSSNSPPQSSSNPSQSSSNLQQSSSSLPQSSDSSSQDPNKLQSDDYNAEIPFYPQVQNRMDATYFHDEEILSPTEGFPGGVFSPVGTMRAPTDWLMTESNTSAKPPAKDENNKRASILPHWHR